MHRMSQPSPLRSAHTGIFACVPARKATAAPVQTIPGHGSNRSRNHAPSTSCFPPARSKKTTRGLALPASASPRAREPNSHTSSACIPSSSRTAISSSVDINQFPFNPRQKARLNCASREHIHLRPERILQSAFQSHEVGEPRPSGKLHQKIPIAIRTGLAPGTPAKKPSTLHAELPPQRPQGILIFRVHRLAQHQTTARESRSAQIPISGRQSALSAASRARK